MLGWIFLQCLLHSPEPNLVQNWSVKDESAEGLEGLLATVDKLGGWKCQSGVSGPIPGEKLSF